MGYILRLDGAAKCCALGFKSIQPTANKAESLFALIQPENIDHCRKLTTSSQREKEVTVITDRATKINTTKHLIANT